MNRDEFLHELRIADDVGDEEPFSVYAQSIADYDADRRVLLKEQREEIDKLGSLLIEANKERYEGRAEIERMKGDLGLQRDYANQLKDEVDRLKAQLAAAKGEVWKAHVPVTNEQHDPTVGLLAGFCERCRTIWPCEYSPERQKEQP